ncbi:MAG: STAS domain-containing protein [Longicatena sp.]
MDIIKTQDGEKLVIALFGRLDTSTASDFEATLEENYEGVKELVLDMKELLYTSSAGLRVILNAQKKMNKQGCMKLINVSNTIMNILDITGFLDILTIE